MTCVVVSWVWWWTTSGSKIGGFEECKTTFYLLFPGPPWDVKNLTKLDQTYIDNFVKNKKKSENNEDRECRAKELMENMLNTDPSLNEKGISQKLKVIKVS